MTHHALVENGIVTNTIVLDDSADWLPPEGAQVVPIPAGQAVSIGHSFDGAFFLPPPPPPGPTRAELLDLAVNEVRVLRQPIISVLDGMQASAIVLGERDAALSIETAKQGLRDLTNIDLGACITLEEMRLAIKARYSQLAAALPLDVRKAFPEAVS